MILPLLQPLRVALERGHGENHPVLTDTTVVDNTAEWGLVPTFLRLDAVCIYRVHNNVPRTVISITTRLCYKLE